MKPIHLNLASRPYRDYSPVYAVVVVMSLVTAFLLLNNVETYYRYRHETRSTHAKIERLKIQTQQERQRQEIADRRLKALDLSRLNAQTRFINAKLAERAFSWSLLLDELESVIDRDVRLLSVTPHFQENGTIQLAMEFQSKGPEGMIKTINRMHADPQFRNPFPNSERVIDGGYAFGLAVNYLPPKLKQAAVPARSRR